MNGNEDEKVTAAGGALDASERERLRNALGALPDTSPRREVWHRIEAQARAERLLQRHAPWQRARWLAGAGIAATVALAVLKLPPFGDVPPAAGPAEGFTEPPYSEEEASLRNLDALMVRSQWLERNLRALPAEPRVMRAGTAATISDLEDRIAAIDYALNDPEADLSTAEEEVFWRERVRLMDSLVQVRYAQARRVSF